MHNNNSVEFSDLVWGLSLISNWKCSRLMHSYINLYLDEGEVPGRECSAAALCSWAHQLIECISRGAHWTVTNVEFNYRVETQTELSCSCRRGTIALFLFVCLFSARLRYFSNSRESLQADVDWQLRKTCRRRRLWENAENHWNICALLLLKWILTI